MGGSIEWLYGGTFDPLHLGHTNVIESLIGACPSWPVRILPCSVPAIKQGSSVSFAQRLEMLNTVYGDNDRIIIDDREGRREGPSYTVDSLLELKRQYPDRIIVMVIGSDNIATLNNWFKAKQLASECHLLVVNRPGSDIHDANDVLTLLGFSYVAQLQELAEKRSGRYHCLAIEDHDISSTQVRNTIKEHRALDRLVPQEVLDYIKQNLIYQ